MFPDASTASVMRQVQLDTAEYEKEQSKVCFRAMLYGSGKRRHMIEVLYLKMRRGNATQIFDFESTAKPKT